jgi:hypothetical protein
VSGELREIAKQHIDYIEVDYGDHEYGPQFFCDRCDLTLDGVWSDMDAMEWLWDEPHNAYRKMAEHWRATHQDPRT